MPDDSIEDVLAEGYAEINRMHSAIVALLDELNASAEADDGDQFSKDLASLNQVTEQHFAFEEDFLRKLAGRAVAENHGVEHKNVLKILADGIVFNAGNLAHQQGRIKLARILKRWLTHEVDGADAELLNGAYSPPTGS